VTSIVEPRALQGPEAAEALVDALPDDTFAQLCGLAGLATDVRVLDGAALWQGQPWGSGWTGGGDPGVLARVVAVVQPETITVPETVGLPPGYEQGWGWGWHALRHPPARQPGEDAVDWVADDEELRALVATAFPDAETPPGDPRVARWFGARTQGRLVAAAAELRTGREAALLSSLTVDPAVRREGWGSAVTTWFARARFDAGAQVVGLGRYSTNTRARALYNRLGFLDIPYVGGTRTEVSSGS
jgi:ribosomal protein S18 acetylase RimI-like enzyme